MINDFLAYLDNDPVSPDSSSIPVVMWPVFTPRVIAGDEAVLRGVLIGTGLSRLEIFLRCAQLADLVAASPFQDAITYRDPRVTYTRAALRSLFMLQGFVVQSPFSVEAVFTSLPKTPTVGRWFLRVLTAAAGNGTLSVQDDRGGTGVASFTYASGVSSLITFPSLDGAVTLFGTPAVGQYWEITYRQKAEPWVQTVARRVDTLSPAAFLSPRLASAFRTCPLQLDRLAAVVAGLGGAV